MNAIPPIEDFNFTKWADELGIDSTFGGATVFPVKMIEKDNDYLLSLDDINCPRKASSRLLYKNDTDLVVSRIRNRRPDINKFIDEIADGDWDSFCENIMWVYRENIALNPEFEYIDLD